MNMVFSIYIGLILRAEAKFSNFCRKDPAHLLLISRYLIIVIVIICYSKCCLFITTFLDRLITCKEMLPIFMYTSSNLTELFILLIVKVCLQIFLNFYSVANHIICDYPIFVLSFPIVIGILCFLILFLGLHYQAEQKWVVIVVLK